MRIFSKHVDRVFMHFSAPVGKRPLRVFPIIFQVGVLEVHFWNPYDETSN